MNITQEKISEINTRHMHAVDKLYRMHGGLSSHVLAYEEGNLTLQVHHSKRWSKDPVTTAQQLAESWIQFNPELKEAHTYMVYVHASGRETGFATSIVGRDNEELIKELAEALAKAAKEKEPERMGELIIGKVSGN